MRNKSIGKNFPVLFLLLFLKIQNKILIFFYFNTNNKNWQKFRGNSDVAKLDLFLGEKKNNNNRHWKNHTLLPPQLFLLIYMWRIHSPRFLRRWTWFTALAVCTHLSLLPFQPLAALQNTCKIELTQGSDARLQPGLRIFFIFQVSYMLFSMQRNFREETFIFMSLSCGLSVC